MLNVATFLKTAVLVALLLRHSIEESRIRTPFNETLRNGALISAVGAEGRGGGGWGACTPLFWKMVFVA